MRISDIFKVPVDQEINPVIKVSDRSEEELRKELDSYVVTEVLERYLTDFLVHYVETRQKDTDQIGVWLHGFVGAGKSHFAKIIGLLLSNPDIAGQNAIDRFRARIQTCRQAREIERLLFECRNNIHTEVIPFHINSEANQAAEDNIARIFSRVFLRNLGFSEDLRIALVEQVLVKADQYEAFQEAIRDRTGETWETVRRPDYWDLYRQEIFEVLATTLPGSYSGASDAQSAFEGKMPIVTFRNFAERVQEYIEDRQKALPGKTVRLLFVVDELGAFVADSGKKLHDTGTLAEEFAKVGKGSIWIFATGHDSLKDLVDNAREHQVDFKWLEGRFKKQFTLTAENIEVVLEERLFKKNTQGGEALSQIYRQKPGAILEMGRLQKTSRTLPDWDEIHFVSCYPFRPYQLILAPDILHSIRTAGGRSEVLAGATRSLLGITQGVLTRNENGYRQADLGRLVPFDQFYAELQDVEIPHQIRSEINSVDKRIPKQEFPLKRVLQALYLIQQLEYVPTSARNLALLLADHIDSDIAGLEEKVNRGLQQLQEASYMVETGGLYKYVSGEERDDAELVAQGKVDVKTVHRRQTLKDKFLNSNVLPIGTVQYEDNFPFDIRVICDGRFNEQAEFTGGQVVNSRGDVTLRMFSPLASQLGDATVEDLEERSLSEPNAVYWIARKSAKIESLLTTLIGTENAMGPIDSDSSQSPERRKRARRYLDELETHVKPQIEEEIRKGFREGHIVFRGTSHPVASGTDKLEAIFHRELSEVIRVVYTQLGRVKVRITNERKTIEAILTNPASRLSSIEPALPLFDEKGDLKRSTPAVADIYDFLDQAAQRGTSVTGADLCARFSGIPYGGDRNLVRVVVAAIFRANCLQIRYENTPYRDYRVDEARRIFLDSRRFDRAELALEAEPPPDPEELKKARDRVQLVFGTRPQETPSAIAEVLESKVQERLAEHRRISAWVEGARFPASQALVKAPEVLSNLIESRRPNQIVRTFLANSDSVQKSVETLDALGVFYDSPRRHEFEELASLRAIGAFLRERVSRQDLPKTIEATDLLDKLWEEGTLLENFGSARAHFLEAVPEVMEIFRNLATRCRETGTIAIENILSLCAEAGVSEQECQELVQPLLSWVERLEGVSFDLRGQRLTIQSLWSGEQDIRALEDRVRRTVEAAVAKQKGAAASGERPKRRIRLREIPAMPPVIRNVDDLSQALRVLEQAVRSALEENLEVELG